MELVKLYLTTCKRHALFGGKFSQSIYRALFGAVGLVRISAIATGARIFYLF